MKSQGQDRQDHNAERYESAILGALLERPEAWADASGLMASDFSTDYDRRIFAAIGKLHKRNCEADIVSVAAELNGKVPDSYLASLLDGVVVAGLPTYVSHLKRSVRDRRFRQRAEQLSQASTPEERSRLLTDLQGLLNSTDADSVQHVRRFDQISDISTMQLPQAEYLVPALGIARSTVGLYTGPDGDGKTYFVEGVALSVATGGAFLGMACLQAPVLYLDLENPGYVVQDRVQSLLGDGNCPTGLRFWGTWLGIEQQPPQAGSELLDAADLADEPLKTHLYRVARLCDETLTWLWQRQTTVPKRLKKAA